MSTGLKYRNIGFVVGITLAILCPSGVSSAQAAQTAHRKAVKAKAKKPELPPLPSGPTGPMQPMPLDAIAAVPPQVTFENNQLTVVAPNSTLADVLRAIRKSTGAEIDVPAAPERVVTHLGPGPARDVLADLLNGSRFNYVLLGAPGNDSALTRVVLVAKTEGAMPNQPTPPPQPGLAQANPVVQPPQEPAPPEVVDPNQADDNNNVVDDSADQQPPPESAEQQQNPDQPQVKTPQQMLQEMQQRQMQMQMQQQQQGQQPPQGSGMPPHPPQEQ
jgi:hypothetical protein